MRVLHLTSGNMYGGIETYLVTLAQLANLTPSMAPHFGVCFPGRLRKELVELGVPVHDLGPVRLSRPWNVVRARRRLRRLLRAMQFDGAVTHGCWPHVVFGPVIRRFCIRLAYSVHGNLDPRSPLTWLASRTLPDEVIANSRYTANLAAQVFPRSPVEVVYLPVRAPAPEDAVAIRCEVRESLGTPAGTVVILQASRMEPWKGHRIFLAALRSLRERRGWEAWIAGGAQRPNERVYLEELKVAVCRDGLSDRVRFLGQRSDVPRLMAAADVYCQPNTAPEPFGLVFVEALQAGLPVVTSGFGGAAEIVDKTCGVLTPPGDIESVVEALQSILINPPRRQELANAAPSRARALCDPARHLSRLAQLFAANRSTKVA